MSVNPENDWKFPNDESTGIFQNFESSFDHLNARLGPTPFKASEISSDPSREPVLHDDFLPNYSTQVRSHGPGSSVGISQTSSFFPEFDFEKEFSRTDPFKKILVIHLINIVLLVLIFILIREVFLIWKQQNRN